MSANDEARDYWERRAAAWAERSAALESFIDVYGLPPMQALELAPGERVLDIGCGPGTTTLAMGDLVGPEGEVCGVDISPGMIAAATARAEAAGATNVTFVVADAQTGALGTGFDAAYSRFGVMFFADPEAAFANIGAALHPGGRLACAVWGPIEVNPWMTLPTLTVAPLLGVAPPVPEPGQPGAFVLADPERVEQILTGAGFNHVANEPIEGTRDIGKDTTERDVRALLEIGPLSEAFVAADAPTQARAIEAVIESFAPFKSDVGFSIPGVARRVSAIKG